MTAVPSSSLPLPRNLADQSLGSTADVAARPSSTCAEVASRATTSTSTATTTVADLQPRAYSASYADPHAKRSHLALDAAATAGGAAAARIPEPKRQARQRKPAYPERHPVQKTVTVGDKELSFRTGLVATQANGAVEVGLGGTRVLVTVCADRSSTNKSFLPLSVNLREHLSGVHRVPGSRDRREGKPSEREVLFSRLIDRPLRPLFPKGWHCETQIYPQVQTNDLQNSPDVMALNAAAAALALSDIPFNGPVAGVRVARVAGKLVAFPTEAEQTRSDINLVVACNNNGIVMVEGQCDNVPEEDVVDTLMFAQEQSKPLLKMQEELADSVGKKKLYVRNDSVDDRILGRIEQQWGDRLMDANSEGTKQQRAAATGELRREVTRTLGREHRGRTEKIEDAFEQAYHNAVRRLVLERGERVDQRRVDEVRPIDAIVGYLPAAAQDPEGGGVHGSALFTRGETQTVAVTTLGSGRDKRPMESPLGDYNERFIVNYTFPPAATGETGRMGSPGRREIGHGHLAQWALRWALPSEDELPGTIRLTSDITESNGSSSQATICGGSLALMDAGVSLKEHVAGIGMGLFKGQDAQGKEKVVILTDITGEEDHHGDMDFKVGGTAEGVITLQMDIKCKGITREILSNALQQARTGRRHVLGIMNDAISKPNALPADAPKPHARAQLTIDPSLKGRVIGKGGETVKQLQNQTGTGIKVGRDRSDGTIEITGSTQEACDDAVARIRALIEPRRQEPAQN